MANIVPPSANPETAFAPSGDTAASAAPPVENQVDQNLSGSMDNNNTVTGSNAPLESREAESIGDTHL